MARRPIDVTLPDFTGKRVVLTGGSDGMGLVIATRLAAAGAELILPVRNPRKGEAALTAIRERAPEANVSLRSLDLSSLESAAALGETLRQEGDPIHLFIGNAGVMNPPERQTTVDGFELQFGTNHLGHAALIGHLLPLLRDGEARVTLQLSIAANRGSVNWDDSNWERSYNSMGAYSQSKIAYGLFGLELDRRSRAGGWGISANLAHPGVAPTNLLAARPEIGRAAAVPARRVVTALSRLGVVGSVTSAGLPALMAATTPGDQGGRFFGPNGVGGLGGRPAEQKLFSRLRSPGDARRMWDLTQQLTKVPLNMT
ncbi:SDR family oxidoreductase [Streptomyces sp. NPDC002131]|uniref:SDR family oxidoreductase n=1 Tax=unclassified Streptomyces TaxID=2593676 RepID=UPI0013BDB43D|nr:MULTISPECIES: SDR family oxidoreductase [unclassified Streptomyces]MCX5134992.1 SDR family oxidoreductase [Streptomyces sp. NBC_00340]NEB27655.1 SDR family NAD(P)-dependent oxidoreductase [Streptomyces sp. SID14446]WSD75932.1 SDR family oxidoreductase [Streptomyces sp. NBC_01558]